MDENRDQLQMSQKDIEAWDKFKPIVAPEAKNYLKKFFSGSLDLFWEQAGKNQEMNYRSLAESFFTLAFDQGLRQPVSIQTDKEQILSNPVYMLTRMAGIDWLKKEIGLTTNENSFSSTKDFQILRFDASNVFEANKFEEGKGGDFLIHQVARGLNEAINILDNQYNGVKLVPIRYGGDEFIVFITGDLKAIEINQIATVIREKITKKKAYFGNQGEERNITIKNDKIELIDPNQIKTEKQRQLFYFFLDRGIVLSQEELESEYERIGDDKIDQFIKDAVQTKREIYPSTEFSLEEKIDYLLKIHPEFIVPFNFAGNMDHQDGTKVRQESFLSFLENSLVDPLLDRIVMTRLDLGEHLKRNHLQQIISFEIKLKELNEHPQLGYAYSDNLIRLLWQRIKQELETVYGQLEWQSKILVGRFGGTIFIGIREGNIPLDESILNKLKQIQITEGGINHQIGVAEIIPEKITSEDDSESIKKKIEETRKRVFEEPTNDWYAKVISFISQLNDAEKNIFRNKLINQTVSISPDEVADINKRLNLELLLRYFLGKRGDTRREKIIEIINKLSESEANLQSLKEIFQNHNQDETN